jgi:hypothetical protein
MTLADGWAAMNLQMPPRVPRTEYSAEGHWDLVRAVTGIEVGLASPSEVKRQASHAFIRSWKMDLLWSTLIGRNEFGATYTDMGHCEYAAGGVDLRRPGASPFTDPQQVLDFDPWQALGARDRGELTRRFERHYRDQLAENLDAVRMTGVYVTLVSGLIDLFGWEMLLVAAGLDPAAFGEVTNRYASWIEQYFLALAAADVPVVMVHDDIVWTAGAIFAPDWYRRYVFTNYRRLLAPLIESGKKVLYTSDGNFTEFINDIVACGVSGLVMEPTTDMAAVAERYGRRLVFVGNADTRILLGGTRQQIRAEVERCMAVGKGCPGFFMAVGNHIPPNTPVENALYYNQVYEELSRR